MNMEVSEEFIKICPTESELGYVGPTTCPTCNNVFPNISSCEMHQIKKHKKASDYLEKKKDKSRRYFCPMKACKYSPAMGFTRYFSKMKYLRQHYMKSHAKRTFACSDCDKSFPAKSLLSAHQQKECGTEFVCIQCDTSYNSREALLTHCHRTGHINSTMQIKRKGKIEFVSRERQGRKVELKHRTLAPHIMENIAAAALRELSRKPVVRSGIDVSTQTSPKPKRSNVGLQLCGSSLRATSTQTDATIQSAPQPPFSQPEPDSDSLMADMVLRQYFTSATQTNQDMAFDLGMFQDIDQHVNNETQTELLPSNLILDEECPALSNTHTQTADLDEYNHNCTQTCDDIFLNDFVELSDIETQTAWASLNVDSLLVSAQTQTLL